ncbi:MAG: MFS transporter [Coprobacillus sp.]
MKKNLAFLSLFSVAFVCQIRGTIAPGMELLYNYYSHYSIATISLMITIVSIAVIPASYLTSRCVGSTITYKQSIIFMNICLLLGGVAPAFIDNLYVVLFFRLIFGIGIGIGISLNKPIIKEYYTSEKQIKYLGYTTIIASLGTIFFQSLVGVFSNISTKAMFLAYLPIIITLFLSFYIPDIPLKKQEAISHHKFKLNKNLLFYVFLFLTLNMLLTCFSINTSSLIAEKSIDNLTITTVTSNNINSLFSILSGLLFGKIYNKYHNSFFPFVIFLCIIAFGLYYIAPAKSVIYIASAILGFSYNLVILYIFLFAANSTKEDSAKAGGYIGIAAGIGGFLATFLIFAFQHLFDEVIYSIIILIIITLIIVEIIFLVRKKELPR